MWQIPRGIAVRTSAPLQLQRKATAVDMRRSRAMELRATKRETRYRYSIRR